MEQQTKDTITCCATAAHDGTLAFPTIVGRLLEAGVAQYHTDYLRAETTYYLGSGESQIEPLHLPQTTIAADFSAAQMAAAVKASQLEGQPYEEFLTRSMQAGCTGYVAYLDGKRVIYFGRLGDMHIEYFPASS